MNFHCSHDGFFSEVYNDVHHKIRPSLYKNLPAGREALIMTLTGHLDWLKMTSASEVLKMHQRIMKAGKLTESHYCLPDNLFEDEEFFKEKIVEPLKEANSWNSFRLPRNAVTISYHNHQIKVLVVALQMKDEIWFCPYNVMSPTLFVEELYRNGQTELADSLKGVPHSEIRRQFIKFCRKKNVEPATGDLLAGVCSWVSNTFFLKLVPDDSGEFNLVIDNHNAREGNPPALTKRVKELMIKLCTSFISLMSSPVEEVQWDVDPDFDPSMTLKERRENHIPKRRAQRLRMILPRRKHVGIGESTGAHSGVKQLQHSRNGHWRRYKNGRRIWIDSYVAGDPSIGSTVNKPKTIEIVPRRGS